MKAPFFIHPGSLREPFPLGKGDEKDKPPFALSLSKGRIGAHALTGTA